MWFVHLTGGKPASGDDRQVTFVSVYIVLPDVHPMTTVTVMLGAVAMGSLAMAIGGGR